ncbi:hypothetical protein [Luteimicrobium sp. DT211]|uniref:hypothetical protein n=1 Tax=Luteimicrobium sp. DT211 TaxID=3393412 RepID=UPI003CF0F8DC
MARWQDELRRLVTERSGALLDAAHGDVPALEDALVEVYTTSAPSRRGHRSERPDRGGRHGSPGRVTLELDDELDGPSALVEAALVRTATRRKTVSTTAGADGSATGAPSDEAGAPDGANVVDVEAVEARVTRARRRRAAAGWGAAGVTAVAAAALALTVAVGGATPAPTPSPTPRTAVPVASFPCGTPSGGDAAGGGAETFSVSLTAQTDVLTPGATWVGTVATTAAGPDPAAVDLGAFAPRPLLLRDGIVVATALRPGGPLVEGPSFTATTFRPCPGVSVDPGAYTVVVDQPVRVGGSEYRVVSNAVAVRVVTPEPTGYRPAWLDRSPFACGSTLEEVAVRTGGATPAALLLDSSEVEAGGVTLSFVNPDATTVTYRGNRELGLLWVQDGVVRSVGHDLSPSDGTVAVAGQTTLRLTGRWDTTDYCSPSGDGSAYPHRLPAGSYEVYGYARVTPPSDRRDGVAWFVQTEGPAVVRIGADGAVRGR